MNPYMAYEAVNTKIITKKGFIFDDDKLQKILECNSVDQVTEFLKSKYNMKQIMEDAKSRELHRDDLETLLNQYEVTEIENILHYFSGPYKSFLQVFLMKFEIADLVLILRKIVKGDDSNSVQKHFTHSENYSLLPFNKLAASKSVQQFIENLKKTPYYNFLKTVTDNDVVKRGFHIEMKLELLFYKTLMSKSAKLNALDRQIAEEILGFKIDILNMQWIYRAKKYYNISPEEMLIYSLQGGKKLDFDRLKKLCYSKTLDEIRQLSNKFLRYSIFITDNDMEIGRNMENYIFDQLRNRKYQGNIGTVISYILTLDIIIKNLVTVTEGIRYKLPKENLKQYLVRTNQRAEVKL